MMIVPGADDMQLYQPTHKLTYKSVGRSTFPKQSAGRFLFWRPFAPLESLSCYVTMMAAGSLHGPE